MAKEKQVKPLFAVKHDFVESLDAFLSEAVFFQQAVGHAIELGAVSEKIKPLLVERLAAFRAKLLSDE